MKIHLLMPMSGQGVRFQDAGFNQPKPLVPILGRPMIERVLESFPSRWPSHFIMADNHLETELKEVLNKLRPGSDIRSVPVHKEGPIRAIECGLENIPDDDAVFVSYCDYGMDWDSKSFEAFVKEVDCDAVVISYTGFHAHYLSSTQYAYSHLIGERVTKVKEKGSFTSEREKEFASSGGYFFKSAKILRNAINFQRENQLTCNNEFYTSLTVEALIQMKSDAEVRVFEIPKFFQWGTPEDVKNFEYWEETFKSYEKNDGVLFENVEQILMPMAGRGARFSDYTTIPKPFISIDSNPMFVHALNSLPKSEKILLVGLQGFQKQIAKYQKPEIEFYAMDSTPKGQAFTTLEGLKLLDATKSLLVSSCDHSIVLDPLVWEKFITSPDCDAAIFTVQNFPGARISPESYSYVLKDDNNFIKSISVKEFNFSKNERPELLVGTFWFRQTSEIKKWTEVLINSGKEVNHEVYLDSVFELMIAAGLRVKAIPLMGYINWGDPKSLSEALYWYEVFLKKSVTDRPEIHGLGNI